MDRRVIITKEQNQIFTFLMENSEIVEIHCSETDEKKEITHVLGNIYIGRVKNIAPNIGAAFIEIAPGRECYFALDQNPCPIFTNKVGRKPFCIGDELLVQVSREAMKSKVPTVTSKLCFTGSFVVLSVGNTRIGISRKVDAVTKQHLKDLIQPYQNDVYGFVIRTNAETASDDAILAEVEKLTRQYQKLVHIAETRICFSCLRQAPKPYLIDLQNIYNDGLNEYQVEDPDLYKEIEAYLAAEQPENLDKLHLYADKQLPLDKRYHISGVIKQALSERVWLKCGGYLVIQPTEALTVIDVNSGKCVTKKSTAKTYLKINLEAAKEAAKQMRLRNLSGIILIDFINLDSEADMQILMHALRSMLARDPVQAVFVDITKLQLVEITRKKVRKPLYECCIRRYNSKL